MQSIIRNYNQRLIIEEGCVRERTPLALFMSW
ncbi:Uncharacterised protein [Rothia dentocariosa]|uniref:Uncharacterized protein n=1 Tax=Rothia dentocariosa TaxID=2047 RepID=A0A3S5BVF0_9MICC|nr:Uncharacterised protein [Rothia dentocariosa]